MWGYIELPLPEGIKGKQKDKYIQTFMDEHRDTFNSHTGASFLGGKK
jgi:hypothetical protein